MSINILNLLDLVLEVPQGTDRLRELILGLAFEGQLSDGSTKPDWDMDRNLKDLGKMIRGITYAKSDSRKDQDDNLTPLLGAANIQQEINYSNLTYVPSKLIKSEQLLLNGDILICMSSGSKHLVGKAASVQDPIRASFGAFCAVYRSTSLVDSNYLALFFQSPKYRKEISSSSRGIGINNLRIGDIESISIPLPPLKEQANIVNKVTELLNLCNELHQSQNFQLALATSVRKSAVNAISAAQTREKLQIAWDRIEDNWEVIAGTLDSIESIRILILDLAVRGQIAPHDLSGLPAEELIKESIQMANRKKSKQSRDNQGDPFEIPKHWVWSTIEDLCETQTGTTPKIQDSDNLQELIHYVTAADMVKLKALKNRSVPMSAAKQGGRIAPKDSVLFVGIGATIGKCCLITSPATFNQQIHAATPRNIYAQYLSLILASGYFQKICKERTNATAIPILNKSKWETIKIPVPPLNEQRKIAETVSKLFDLCDELESLLTIKSSIAEKFSQSVVSASA